MSVSKFSNKKELTTPISKFLTTKKNALLIFRRKPSIKGALSR